MKSIFGQKYFWFLFFFLFIIFTRLCSTLSLEVISWDEATYILAGREILLGYLPYESSYEMKPPLLYYIYSIPLYLHSSLESVRIYGAFCIFISSILIYEILIRFVESKIAALGSLVFISLMNYYFWLETSSEIVSLPFLLLSFIFLLNHQKSKINLVFCGFFLSISTLIRLNLGYLVVFVLIYLVFKRNHLKEKISDLCLFCLSGLVPLIFLILLYYNKGILDLFLIGTFKVPLVYSSENTLIDGFVNYSKTIFKLIFFNPLYFAPLFMCLVVSFKGKSVLSNSKNLFIIFLLGILFSTIASGQGFSHHFILIVPFFVIFILSRKFNKKRYSNFIHSLLFIVILNSSFGSVQTNYDLVKQKFDYTKNHKIREISDSIIENNNKILALDYHLIYFYKENIDGLKLIHVPALVRNTTQQRLDPLVKINYLDKDFISKTLNKEYDYILCSTRICVEGRPNLDNNKIKDLLKNYSVVKRVDNFSRWEHTKPGNLLLYKKIK
jgi:4-amino-4-deoxy-L-arabinose transferase-like glycosyltransferase